MVRRDEDPGALLREQLEYYRQRAGEYDRWFERRGRYDRGPQANQRWFAEVCEVQAALAELPLDGTDVLELAGGTGIWSEQLVGRAARLTVVDGSSEMIAENRRRLGPASARVDYLTADLFSWTAPRTFDAVVFCFWISHVPADRLDAFLATVAAMLKPDGLVFFLDGRPEPTSSASDHHLPEPGEELMLRRLDDGREYRIVKNFWPAPRLQERCRQAGLEVSVQETTTYFQYGRGRRAR